MVRKLNRTSLVSLIGVALLTGALACSTANAVELITNGGFETGDFSGWTTNDVGLGQWYVRSGTTVPESGNSSVGPASGSFYAVSDQTGAGTHALLQAFTVPAGSTSVVVSFDMFMNDWSDVGPLGGAAGLDHTVDRNQHARVDIMTSGAVPFSTAAADVVANLVAPGVDGGTDPNAYTAYSFDVTGSVSPGTSYKLRFGEVDNQLFFNQGVDNVSVFASTDGGGQTGVIPEPATIALLALGLCFAGMVFAKRRRSAA